MLTGYLSEIFVSFQGEGLHAGRRHLFVRMAGCNLRCRYCDTPDSLERVPRFRVFGKGAVRDEPNPVDVGRLDSHLQHVLTRLGPVDGTALTGGEPLLQADFLARFLSSATPLPRPRLLETNGMMPDRLAIVLPHIDVVSMDIKIPSNSGEPESWAAHERFLDVARGKVYVKVLVDEGTTASDFERAVALVAQRARETPFFLQPITNGAAKVEATATTLEFFFEAARRSLPDVRILPQTHRMLGIQ